MVMVVRSWWSRMVIVGMVMTVMVMVVVDGHGGHGHGWS